MNGIWFTLEAGRLAGPGSLLQRQQLFHLKAGSLRVILVSGRMNISTDYERLQTLFILHGAISGIQLAHAGRKASCSVPWEGGKQLNENQGGWTTLGPGNVPFYEDDRTPEPLNRDGISKVVSDFKTAAARALCAGFKVIEIHSAHGYLLHEFLSPLTNHREDEYGGSFENRTRLIGKIVDAVKLAWPAENPLFVRISVTDWTEGGWTLEESVKLAYLLKEKGVDLIDCSSGGNVLNAKIPFSPGLPGCIR